MAGFILSTIRCRDMIDADKVARWIAFGLFVAVVAFLLWGVVYWGFVDKQREQDDDRE